MSAWHLILAEIHHRAFSFGLGLLAVVVAAALFVAGPSLVESYRADTEARLAERSKSAEEKLAEMRKSSALHLAGMKKQAEAEIAKVEKETIQIMRDLGFNLRIFHKNTDPGRLLASFQAFDMPEEYVTRLATSSELTKVAHLVATLREMIEWNGEPRLLIGYAQEAAQSTSPEKRPMGYVIKPGTVFLGHVAGKGHQVGDTVEVRGQKFTVAQILDEHGTREEDIAILMALADAQKLLEKPGRISEIIALGCRCKTVKRVEEIRDQLAAVLPEAQVVEMKSAADARDTQRKLIATYHQQAIADYQKESDKLLAQEEAAQKGLAANLAESRSQIEAMLGRLVTSVVPVVVFAAAIFVGVMAWNNVRERQTEIGLLRAIGKDSLFVLGLFLGRAGLLGLIGGVVGCLLGMQLARQLAASALEIAPEHIGADSWMMTAGMLGAPLVAMLASWLPALLASQQDPASVLAEG